MACQTCRARKVRCDRTRPRCQNCLKRALTCIYHGERRLRRESGSAGDRGTARHGSNHSASPPASDPPSSTHAATVESGTAALRSRDILDQLLADNAAQLEPQQSHPNPSVWIRTELGDEYTGPSSGIAALSDEGLSWITRRAKGCGCLCTIFKQLRQTLLQHLRQPKCTDPGLWENSMVSETQKALPPWDVVERYVEAYFDRVQTIFPVLDREHFRSQLAQYRLDPACTNASWKALLLAVLASGCRAALSDETAEAFQVSGSEAWSYFVAALSMESMLVHVATDLTAVQALAVLTVYAQGLSSPQRLEYTLCSTAVRLAFSIALNRATPDGWSLGGAEMGERRRTFWTLYCLDKTLALRCGRPSLIDDEDISCPFPAPNSISFGASIDRIIYDGAFGFFLCFTRYSRICSNISRHLYSALALGQPCTHVSEKAAQLLADLQKWQTARTEIMGGQQSMRLTATEDRIGKQHLLILDLSYNYAICAVFRRLSPMFCQPNESEDEMEEEARRLRQIAGIMSQVEAARSMVLLTKHFDVESYSPGCVLLANDCPHLICNPSETTAHRDIALMEVAVGHFGRLDYVTSGAAHFTQVAEFVRQARFLVDKTSSPICQCQASSHARSMGNDPAQQRADHTIDSPQAGLDSDQLGEGDYMMSHRADVGMTSSIGDATWAQTPLDSRTGLLQSPISFDTGVLANM